MISMVDSDGDGQVSYEEFHRLVIDPDPSRADFGTEPIKADAQEAAQVSKVSVTSLQIEALLGKWLNLELFRAEHHSHGSGGEGKAQTRSSVWLFSIARPVQK